MRWPSGCPVEIVAHRGASAEAPENTLAAINLAWQLEADAVEVDIRLTADGDLAVLHDSSLLRTAGVDREVSDLTMVQLRQIDVGSWKGRRWAGESVVSLSRVLSTVPEGRRLFVELKKPGNRRKRHRMVDALEHSLATASLPAESVVLISFHPGLIQEVKDQLPRYEAMLVVEQTRENDNDQSPWSPSLSEIISTAKDSGLDGVDLSNTAAVDQAAIEQLKSAGLASCVWTVNSTTEAQSLADAGVESLTTDDPQAIREALRD